jgi:hypothetical protein
MEIRRLVLGQEVAGAEGSARLSHLHRRVTEAAGDVHWPLAVCCARAGEKKTAPARAP